MNCLGYIAADQERNSGNTRTKIFLRLLRIQHNTGGIAYMAASILRFLLFDKYGVDIDPSTSIGNGLKMPHLQGIIVAKEARIGNNCTLYHQVTIGANDFLGSDAPTIGDDVYIGCGAKLIGKITIGNNVRIGANAIVTKNIPSNVTVVGINYIIKK